MKKLKNWYFSSMISWLFKFQGIKEFWVLFFVTAWEVSLFHSLVRYQVFLWIFIWCFTNFFKTMHLFKLTNFSHCSSWFNCIWGWLSEYLVLFAESSRTTCRGNWSIGFNKFVSIGLFVEIVSSVWPANTIRERACWSNPNSWFTLLHIFKTLPDLLAFCSSAIEYLISYRIIWNNRLCFVHNFSLWQYRFILLIFSNNSNILETLRHWKYIKECSIRINMFLITKRLWFKHFTVIYHICVRLFSVNSV
jgi:hypothetical protein